MRLHARLLTPKLKFRKACIAQSILLRTADLRLRYLLNYVETVNSRIV